MNPLGPVRKVRRLLIRLALLALFLGCGRLGAQDYAASPASITGGGGASGGTGAAGQFAVTGGIAPVGAHTASTGGAYSLRGGLFAQIAAAEDDPATIPSVTTASPTGVTNTAATLGGEVTVDGGSEVTGRGVVHATVPGPTLATGTVVAASAGGTGIFTVSATGLSEGTTYFARAYSTNSVGTAYGEEVAFTTGATVAFTNGVATFEREILPGGNHRYDFAIAGPRFVSLSTTGGAALRAELRDAEGAVIATFDGDGDFDLDELLLAGGYVLEVRRLTGQGAAQDYTLSIDAGTVAATRPDLSVGTTASAPVGAGSYVPARQLAGLTSLKARPVTGYAAVSNRGNLPDDLALRATGGNAFFKVAWFGPTGNATAALLSGAFRTPALDSGDAAIALRASVTPNKKKLTKKKGKRTTILKKTLVLSVTAASTFDPATTDAASIQVKTK